MFRDLSDRQEGRYGEEFKPDKGWQPITDAGSRMRKAVASERDERDCK